MGLLPALSRDKEITKTGRLRPLCLALNPRTQTLNPTLRFDTKHRHRVTFRDFCRMAKLVRLLTLDQGTLGSNPSPATRKFNPSVRRQTIPWPDHLGVRMWDSQSHHRGSNPRRAAMEIQGLTKLFVRPFLLFQGDERIPKNSVNIPPVPCSPNFKQCCFGSCILCLQR